MRSVEDSSLYHTDVYNSKVLLDSNIIYFFSIYLCLGFETNSYKITIFSKEGKKQKITIFRGGKKRLFSVLRHCHWKFSF